MYQKMFFIVVTLSFLSVNLCTSSDLYLEMVETIKNSSTYILPTDNEDFFKPKNLSDSQNDFGTYDFIIVGGGTAGGVLANRLTEKPYSVLIIEAGKKDPPVAKITGLTPYYYDSPYNWGYNTVPQKNACFGSKNRSCIYPRGKVLGGSSTINGAVYVRGSPEDFDTWEALGNAGWSYKHCLPYFKKSENVQFTVDRESEYHGFHGPEDVNVVKDTPELTHMLLEAYKELGVNEGDYNGRNHYVVGRLQSFIDFNVHASSSYAFIRPAKNRTNLKITLESLVTKIKIQNGKAQGVEFFRHGKKYFAKATKEVILSAGSINSPQILMLSGIGPAEELNKHGITILADLPVGKYLYDHMFFFTVNYRTKKKYFETTSLKSFKSWKKGQRPLNSVPVQLLSYWNTSKHQFGVHIFQSLGVSGLKLLGFNNEYLKSVKKINIFTDIAATIFLSQPKSHGTVTLKSNDPKDFPLVDPNYFSDPSDLDTFYEGIKIGLKFNNTKAFRKLQITYLPIKFPGCDEKYEKMSKKWWYCGLKYLALSGFHPIGTTRMGTSPKNSVVDSKLNVHGIKKLRVVDAGIMPSPIAGHPNAAVVMIAEKIADEIKAKYS